MIKKDLTNRRFGKLVVLYRGPTHYTPKGKPNSTWICQCDCGNIIKKNIYNLNDNSKCDECKKIDKRLKNQYNFDNDYAICYACNTNNKFLFDKEDYDLIKDYTWRENKYGYLYTEVGTKPDNKILFIHRLIMNSDDKDMCIDHINHDTYDNRKINLRLVSKSQNHMNTKLRSNNTSGTTGVYWNKLRKYWYADIIENNKYHYIGSFKNKEDAIKARKEAEEKYFGEYSYDNSIKLKGV